MSFDLITKRLEVLKDAVPKLIRVGVLWQGGAVAGSDSAVLKELRPVAVVLKLRLDEIETQRDVKGLENAFKTAKQKQVGAIMTTGAPYFFAERKRFFELAGKY